MGIIKDPDGFCNIRERGSKQSNIQDTVANGKLVFSFNEDAKDGWLLVQYHKGDQSLTGYVHKSRVVFLSDMTSFKVTTLKDSMLTLGLNDMLLTMTKGKYTSTGRKITYEKNSDGGQLLKYIDGKFPWGTDGDMPRTKYNLIKIGFGTHTLTFPKTSYQDLFEPNFHSTLAYLDKTTNKIYIEADNSDGAGSYTLIWVLENEKIIQREILITF